MKKSFTGSPDFEIKSAGRISQEFIKREVSTFAGAAFFIHHLPYGRNANKTDLRTVFSDGCGTCSTKHALLKQLAEENHFSGLRLMTGLFKMNSTNTPDITRTLKQYRLDYIPEAHNYLRYGEEILDFTKPGFHPSNYLKDLLEETEILPHQIADHKVAYHKHYLAQWLAENRQMGYSLEAIWAIREQCIRDLAG